MNATAENVQSAETPPDETPPGEMSGIWVGLLVGIMSLYLIAVAVAAAWGAYEVWPGSVTMNTAGAAVSSSPATCQVSACHSQLERNLVLFVLYLGILGACIHAMTSMATFVGNRRFKKSWCIWYLLRPLIGGVLAWIVYLVFRGGFLGLTDVSALNPYAFGALAALSGLFSKRVIDKLSELVDTLFRMPPGGGDNARGDKPVVRKPQIKEVSPKELRGDAATQELLLRGENFKGDMVVRLADTVLKPVQVEPTVTKVIIEARHIVGRKSVDISLASPSDAEAVSNVYPVPVATA